MSSAKSTAHSRPFYSTIGATASCHWQKSTTPTFWSDATVDHVEILPGAVIAGREGDTYQLEAAIPLQALGLQPTRIPRIRADFGIDLGDQTGRQTIERAFWSNPNTKLISDVTSEVTLTPRRWGTFHFIQP